MNKMDKLLLLVVTMQLTSLNVRSQPNCYYFYPEGSLCRQACLASEKVLENPQGSWQSQQGLDSILALCPEFAYGWQQKSIPFLKRGDYASWRKFLDKAVELDPISYLGYRAACLFDVLRDYKAALLDLERLEKLKKSKDLGVNPGGEYDLRIFKALILRKLGQTKKSIELFEEIIKSHELNQRIGLYDYYYYGTTLFRLGRYNKALEQFEKQKKIYKDFAETYYYMGCIYEKRNQREKAKENFDEAAKNYKLGYYRNDPYDSTLPDQIYLKDIIEKQKNYR